MEQPMSTPPRSLRTHAPQVFAWVESLREAFGADDINAAIQGGLAGLPTFHATERGPYGDVEIGTPLPEPDPNKVVSGLDMVTGSNAAVTTSKKAQP